MTKRILTTMFRALPAGIALLALTAVTSIHGSPAGGTESAAPLVVNHGPLVNVFAGDIHVRPNERVRGGPIVNIGGDVVIEGDVDEVIVILGSLRIEGRVRGQVVSILTDTELRGADIGGQLINVLGAFEESGSRVWGHTVNIPFFALPGLPVRHILLWFRAARLFAIFVALLLLVALMPDRVRAIGEETPVRYVTAFFVGLLGYLGWLIVITLLSATVIGLPLAVLAFYVLKWLGIAGIFFAVGRRLARGFGGEMSTLGAVLLAFGVYALAVLLPTPLGWFGLGLIWGVVGTLFLLLVEIPAVGMVILTRAGSPPRTSPGAPPIDVPPPGPATPPPTPPQTPSGAAGGAAGGGAEPGPAVP